MATKAEAKDFIFAFFKAGLDAAYPSDTPPVAYPNLSFDAPTNSRWLSIVAPFANAGQESLGEVGSRKFVRTGNINILVSTPLLKGTLESDTLCENILDIFEGSSIDLGDDTSVFFRNAKSIDIGPGPQFFLATVNIDFEYRVIK